MAKTICEAKKTGEVKRRGTPTVEWRDEDGTPHYYCYGYNDASTEELLSVCKECKDNVIFAQRDLEIAQALQEKTEREKMRCANCEYGCPADYGICSCSAHKMSDTDYDTYCSYFILKEILIY